MVSIAKRADGQWQARYRDDDGRETPHFDPRSTPSTGSTRSRPPSSLVYVDPTPGRPTFQAYAEAWRATQPHRPTNVRNVEQHLRRYAQETLGDRPLAAIDPTRSRPG